MGNYEGKKLRKVEVRNGRSYEENEKEIEK
jgi:hypothetical protein